MILPKVQVLLFNRRFYSVAGAVVQDAAHSMALFLLGLLLQGLFLRDFVDKIPLYYDSLPRISQFFRTAKLQVVELRSDRKERERTENSDPILVPNRGFRS